MAELLILVVVAGLVLLYAADRARKLRTRARRMGAMNDRLDAAAAKVDEQQERKQARVRASAELTSVLPAIKRPPLTLPGVPGPAAGPEEEEPGAGTEDAPDGIAAEGSPAAQTGPDAADSPAAEDSRAAAEEVAPEPIRAPEGTLTMGRVVVPDTTPAPKLRLTSDGTLIMPPVPGQGPAPAGETVPPPAPSRGRPRTSQRQASQQGTSQE
jgi:hypothetical protein